MDIELLKNQEAGLIAKGKALRADEAAFLKASGLDEEIEKAGAEGIKLEKPAEEIKQQLAGLKARKAEAVQATAAAMAEKMGDILPDGKAIFTIDDGAVFIGWDIGGKVRPYTGLSGGEKVVFESALIYALGGDMLIMEAAEVDNNRLPSVLEKAGEISPQVICATCHIPNTIPEGWEAISI